jgi:hypothetical protein
MTQLELPRMDMIVINPETSERYIQTPDDLWAQRLLEYRDGVIARSKRLEPILRRAARRNEWRLYHAAQKAAYRHYPPSPMPWGHIMFEGIGPYTREEN